MRCVVLCVATETRALNRLSQLGEFQKYSASEICPQCVCCTVQKDQRVHDTETTRYTSLEPGTCAWQACA